MPAMNPLFLGLVAAGIVLVAGVLIYNWLQERRVRRRISHKGAPRAIARRDVTTPSA